MLHFSLLKGVKVKKIVVFFLGIFLTAFCFEYFLRRYKNMDMNQFMYPQYYSENFPEHLFSCRSGKEREYKNLVTMGYEKMRSSRIVICGLARDLGTHVVSITKRIDQTGKLFKDYKVLIFENDSSDGTRQALQQWQETNSHVHLIECDVKDCIFGDKPMYHYGVTSNNRISRMAYFRNEYLKIVQKNYKKFDYMMVLDFDLKGPWSLDGIAHSIAQDNWDAIAAYGMHALFGTLGSLYVLYDAQAYVPQDKAYEAMETKQDIVQNYVNMNFYDLYNVKKCDPLVPVKSSFSGLALYKIPSIKNAWYQPGICEHIGFHKHMTKNGHGNIFINPSLLLLSGNQGPPDILELFF